LVFAKKAVKDDNRKRNKWAELFGSLKMTIPRGRAGIKPFCWRSGLKKSKREEREGGLGGRKGTVSAKKNKPRKCR